jgi:2,4-dienoyl-CoA reductase-like NADH-dependent reductase (Old Yellow Enzyme family)/thioredoxin reductase
LLVALWSGYAFHTKFKGLILSSRILTPTKIGDVTLKNRVFLPGHTTNFGLNNLPTERNGRYLAARARGGVGLIISEAIRIHPTSAGRALTMGAFDDACIPAYEKLTKAVHEAGAAIFAQVMHAGRQANGEATHTAAWSASNLPWTVGGQVPHVMSQADIKKMVKAFGAAAKRMQQANFDGLEIHLGHGHLIQQFLSPVTNLRTDSYGGSMANRMRFAIEVLTEVFNAVPNLPVGIRISADEFLKGGLDPAQMLEVVAALKDYELSFVHTSHSAYHGSWSLPSQFADMNFGHAPYREHAGIFKTAFPDLPVLAVCRLDTISEAAELIDNDEADLVGLARPHIADPELVNKYIANRESEINSCIACNQECIGRVEKNLPISCVVNPEVGAEKVWAEIRAIKHPAKRVLVIGGGPAGMKAALSAAKTGHQVTLVEAGSELGGQVRLASSLAKRNRFRLLVADLIRDVNNSKIEVKLNTEITALDQIAAQYESVIVATGASFAPRNFGDGIAAISPQTAIATYGSKKATSTDPIVIVDEEGSWIAGSIAEELATNGHQIHLVSPTAALFGQITIYSKLALIPRLRELGVQIYLSSRVESSKAGVKIINNLNNFELELANCAAIIDCGPRVANDQLYQAVETDQPSKVQVIGDALSPRTAAEAVYEGNALGVFLDLDLALAALDTH